MRTAITCLLVWTVAASPAYAWNATGHKIIASIAFRQLTADEQAKVVAMLKKHPRYTEDFADQIPEDVRSAGEAAQNEWLFQQVAVWPDIVRSGPQERRAFNRSEWHYINAPIYLTDSARSQLESGLTVNRQMRPPTNATPDTPHMNIVQVIQFTRKETADKSARPQDRAV